MTPDVIDVLARLKRREYFIGDDDLVVCSVVGGRLDAFVLLRRFRRGARPRRPPAHPVS